VEDIWDEFNHGIVHPRAIRDFVDYAYHHWQPPAPRFVLLVGDASWDFKNEDADDWRYADWTWQPRERWRFVKNRSTPYPENADRNHRNLVPTWSYLTFQGPAAADTMFVCVDGDDLLPDLAIGRLPAVSAEEVEAMVAKTLAVAKASGDQSWRRRVLFIADDDSPLQREGERTAVALAERGFEPLRVYADADTPSNEPDTREIIEAFDGGLGAVHFIGYGGAYIWRTRPSNEYPDKDLDLLRIADVDRLQATDHLPIVLSLTCYTAPFDHPSADSLGEKLMRAPGRGAVAVLAASWRDNPSPFFGRTILEAMAEPGMTVGEAILEAKRGIEDQVHIQTFNLLGDPALPATLLP
jgi:hypothetical protein